MTIRAARPQFTAANLYTNAQEYFREYGAAWLLGTKYISEGLPLLIASLLIAPYPVQVRFWRILKN